MTVLAAAAPSLAPRPPGGMLRGALLALVVHGLLLAALTVTIDWRTHADDTVSAELWAAVPQVAAPRVEAPPAPAPTPAPPAPPVQREEPKRDADIATERDKREQQAKAEREQQERDAAEKRKREQQERDRKAAEDKRLAEQREENLRRMLAQAGSGPATSTGTAAQDAGPSSGYRSRLVAHIKPNIVFTETIAGNPAAEVEVRAGPSGTIVARRLVKSSGIKEWDEAVLRAIDRTGTLPRDVDGRVPSTLLIAFRPND